MLLDCDACEGGRDCFDISKRERAVGVAADEAGLPSCDTRSYVSSGRRIL